MKETDLRIRLFGDPALRKKAVAVTKITQDYTGILSRMAQLMYDDAGIGLAAPQVGINENLIVVDIGAGLYKLINPKILRRSGSQVNQEGCLSIPGICVKVRRADYILVNAQDEDGKEIKLEAQGLLACVLQHEIDHLSGKLIVDYASLFEKLKIRKGLGELKKRSLDEKLSEPEKKSCQLQL